MKNFVRITFIIIACIFPIFIGSLHTVTHFNDLLSPDIQSYLQEEFIILGKNQSLWNTWGIVSFKMGISFITIGLINIFIVKKFPKSDITPLGPILAMLLFQISVINVGNEYKQDFQLYGGMTGALLLTICVFLVLRIKQKE